MTITDHSQVAPRSGEGVRPAWTKARSWTATQIGVAGIRNDVPVYDIGNGLFTVAGRDDALLAAAAPELADACAVIAKAELYDPATGIIDADVLEICQQVARAALSKAQGQTP